MSTEDLKTEYVSAKFLLRLFTKYERKYNYFNICHDLKEYIQNNQRFLSDLVIKDELNNSGGFRHFFLYVFIH